MVTLIVMISIYPSEYIWVNEHWIHMPSSTTWLITPLINMEPKYVHAET
jgi:hypothetical protein